LIVAGGGLFETDWGRIKNLYVHFLDSDNEIEGLFLGEALLRALMNSGGELYCERNTTV
jgi:hypothetical protein